VPGRSQTSSRPELDTSGVAARIICLRGVERRSLTISKRKGGRGTCDALRYRSLMASIDPADPFHTHCGAALSILPAEPLLTTWPCLVEAMYLLWRASGSPAQEELWDYLRMS
jgi:hypothetical protein